MPPQETRWATRLSATCTTLSWARPRPTTGSWPLPARRRRKAIRKSQATEGCTLFRAVAAAEGVHAERHLRLLGEAVVQSTEANLQSSFERESTVNRVTYPEFIRDDVQPGARRGGETRRALQASIGGQAARGDSRLLRLSGVRLHCRTRSSRGVPHLWSQTGKVYPDRRIAIDIGGKGIFSINRGRCRAVLLTAAWSDSKSDLHSPFPQNIERIQEKPTSTEHTGQRGIR
jgi:hypothetical protein